MAPRFREVERMDEKYDSIEIVAGPEVEEFANALDNCLSPLLNPTEKRKRILDLPRKYHENAVRRLTQLRPKRQHSGPDDVDMDVDGSEVAYDSPDLEELERLEKEVQTWDLVRRLLPLRYADSDEIPSHTHSVASASSPKQDMLQQFLLTDPIARERHAILQWLQTNAQSGPDIDELARELQQNADRGDIIAHGWLHTRSAIKLRKRVTAWPHLLDRQSPSIAQSHLTSEGAPLVTQLDPDAVTRQGRKLEPQDEYFERAIWLGCFEHLRRGSNLQVIRDWCQERTEMWRAVSMSAMLPTADDSAAAGDISAPSLALWRRMCFGLARQGGSDDYERAVYGLLSGDITSVEKVAKRWDDFLFANYNALLRTQLDTYVLGQCSPNAASTLTQSFSSFDAVQFLGVQAGVEKRLIRSLESNKSTHDEAMEPSKALQAAIIAQDIDHHLYEQGLVMTEDANQTKRSLLLPRVGPIDIAIAKNKYFGLSQEDGLRIVSHVYVLGALLKKSVQEDHNSGDASPPEWSYAHESILAGYTDFLRRARLPELIPLYCSILETPRQYEVLSWNLIHEEDAGQRHLQLKLVKKAGINVSKFVDRQACLFLEELGPVNVTQPLEEIFSILEASPPTAQYGRAIKADFFGIEEGVVETKDEYVIRSLEWLLLVDKMWPMVFSMGTKAYKFFLRHAHLNAARRLMERVPFDSIMRDMMGQDEAEGAWYDDVEFWTQLLERSDIEIVTAQQIMADARNFRELEALVKALDNLETIASLREISMDTEALRRDFWLGVGGVIKKTKDFMQPLLHGWLVAGIEGGDDELRELRQAYLPETVLAYVSALHFAGTGVSRDNLLECMELAAVVAERNSDVADTFVRAKRMGELVEAFAASSKALAVSTAPQRQLGGSNKKLREMGWSRDVWSVKSGSRDSNQVESV